jgi:hypothetical protein
MRNLNLTVIKATYISVELNEVDRRARLERAFSVLLDAALVAWLRVGQSDSTTKPGAD